MSGRFAFDQGAKAAGGYQGSLAELAGFKPPLSDQLIEVGPAKAADLSRFADRIGQRRKGICGSGFDTHFASRLRPDIGGHQRRHF